MTTEQLRREELVDRLIDLAIDEDIASGDVTTDSIIPESTAAVATMTAKADGVISGLPIVERVFRRFQNDIVLTPMLHDGDRVSKGDVIPVWKAAIRLCSRRRGRHLTFFRGCPV